MIAVVPSATLVGTTGRPVAVEVHVGQGFPGLTVVGLPDTAVREARDRVRAAVLSSGLPWPAGERMTVNLAPSAIPKAGAGLDLPMAIGVLVASGVLSAAAAEGVAFVGELGLDGSVRHVPGMLALADALPRSRIVVPAADADEAMLVRPGSAWAVSSLHQLVGMLQMGLDRVAPSAPDSSPVRRPVGPEGRGNGDDPAEAEAAGPARRPDLSEVRGQQVGRRAVEVAAAGGHHLLFVGPPGSGKTMLAERLPGLLPPLRRRQAIEVSQVHSAAGLELPAGGLLRRPPFRAPHHGASAVSLIGGGTTAMRPGELSLATHGVLFLDEMGEFPAPVLDALRQPLESGEVHVSRARGAVRLPARILLVGAMNPCPCGEGGPMGSCRCSEAARARYARRLSGPLLDRFDLAVPLWRPDPAELVADARTESSATVAGRVAAVRALAAGRGVSANAWLPGASLECFAPLRPEAAALLEHHLRAGRLSGRGLHGVRRVARTIADLDAGTAVIEEHHVAEALALRAGFDGLIERRAA